jgi:DHA1 family inner membrane transport protein
MINTSYLDSWENMDTLAPNTDKVSYGLLFVLVIAFAGFSTNLNNPIAPLIQTEMASTFQISIGTAGQVGIYAGFAAIVAGLFMAIFAVRFNHKSLLLVGLLCFTIASLGSFLAPNYAFYQSFISLHGVADVMVIAMGSTLIGEFIILEKRPRAVSILHAAQSSAYIVAAPIGALLASWAGWRSVLGYFLFPVSGFVLLLAFLVLPSSKPVDKKVALEVKGRYFAGFKPVFSDKSAIGMLVGLLFAYVSSMVGVFTISFFKIRFHVSTGFGAEILMVIAIIGVLSALATGVIAPRVGRKNTLVVCAFLGAVFSILSFYLADLWASLILKFLFVWFSAMAGTAGAMLAIELVPKFRPTLMSLFGVFGASGAILGVIIGGRVLDASKSFASMGLVLGGLGMVGLVPTLILVHDPFRTKQKKKIESADAVSASVSPN